jgi:hypothetical protein
MVVPLPFSSFSHRHFQESYVNFPFFSRYIDMKRKIVIFFIAICLIFFIKGVCGGEVQVLERDDVRIFFEPPLGGASREVANIYEGIAGELADVFFGWRLSSPPTVLLLKDPGRFHRMAESQLTIAFAVPSKGLIVIDYSKMTRHPFNLKETLKHEVCHLLLHDHITEAVMPRWLNEGLCQWASGGVVDIIMDPKRSFLNRAAFRGKFIPLSSLQRGFPRNNDALMLAYEESKGVIEHIISRFGTAGIFRLLERMKRGEEVHVAVQEALSIPLEKLEREWHRSLRRKMSWFTYLSYHLYEILFAFGALVTIYAFIRAMVRKKAYMNEDEE